MRPKRNISFDQSVQELIPRLFAKRQIDPQTGCWNHTGAPTGPDRNYRQVFFRGSKHRVHRLAAMIWLGFSLESKLFVCHTCDNPPCFNPDHLFIGTAADNMRDMMLKGRAVIPSSRTGSPHKLTPDIVLAIREDYRNKVGGYLKLSRKYGIARSMVQSIVRYKYWRHVP